MAPSVLSKIEALLGQIFPPEEDSHNSLSVPSTRAGEGAKGRKVLGLPLDKRIVFSFGFGRKDVVSVFPALKEVAEEYFLRYKVIANSLNDHPYELHDNDQYRVDVPAGVFPLGLSCTGTSSCSAPGLATNASSS